MAMGQPPINDVKEAQRHDVAYLTPPKELNTEERRTWLALVRDNPHLNTVGYGHLLEVYVQALCRRRELTAIVKRDGYTVSGSTGNIVAHPAVKLIKDAEGTIGTLSQRLAISVAARAELGKAGRPKKPAKTGRPSTAARLRLA